MNSRTRTFIIAVLMGLWPLGVWAQVSTALGPRAIESTMTYTATVVLPEGMKATKGNVATMIHEQTKHLLSEFESEKYANYIGAPRNGGIGVMGLGAVEKFEIVGKAKRGDGLIEVTYRARQKILVESRVMKPKETTKIQFFLPRDPTRIYVRKRTDKKYYEKEYFYYYWQPPYREKDLKYYSNPKDEVDLVEANVRALVRPNLKAKPNYRDLATHIRKDGELRISLLFGFDHSSQDSQDLGRQSYDTFLEYFKGQGFKIDRHRDTPSGPFVDLVKNEPGMDYPIRIALSANASDVNTPIAFSRRVRAALETSHIVVYSGHSNLGGALDLDSVIRLSSPDPEHPVPIHYADHYQVFYIDSCASYYFYTQLYSRSGRGMHNMDVVSNGLTADFSSQNSEVKTFLNKFLKIDPKRTWLDILAATESVKKCTYLLNVANIPHSF